MFVGCAKRVVPHNNSQIYTHKKCFVFNSQYSSVYFFSFSCCLFFASFLFTLLFLKITLLMITYNECAKQILCSVSVSLNVFFCLCFCSDFVKFFRREPKLLLFFSSLMTVLNVTNEYFTEKHGRKNYFTRNITNVQSTK